MTESRVETTQVTLTLPVLHPSQTPREAVAHLAHMFNDFGEHPPFEEIGKYGPKTTEAVKRIQKEHGLQQTNRDVECLQPVGRGEPTMGLTGAGIGG